MGSKRAIAGLLLILTGMLVGGCAATPRLTPEGTQARAVKTWVEAWEQALEQGTQEDLQAYWAPDSEPQIRALLQDFLRHREQYTTFDLTLWIQEIRHRTHHLQVSLFWDLEAHSPKTPIPVYRHGDVGILLPDQPPYQILQTWGLTPWQAGVLP